MLEWLSNNKKINCLRKSAEQAAAVDGNGQMTFRVRTLLQDTMRGPNPRCSLSTQLSDPLSSSSILFVGSVLMLFLPSVKLLARLFLPILSQLIRFQYLFLYFPEQPSSKLLNKIFSKCNLLPSVLSESPQ